MHSKSVRWIKVCHLNLSVQDYHRYRQLISRLPYTQSPWGPETSSKGIVEISGQLQIELGREYLYTCSHFLHFLLKLRTYLSHFEVILLTCITFFFFALQCECTFFKYQAFDLCCSTRTLYRGWKPFLYQALLCREEDYSSLEEVGNIPSESSFQSSSA